LWHRANQSNSYSKFLIGRPVNSDYTPIDILFRAPVDSWDTRFVFVTNIDTINDVSMVSICGLNFNDIPPFGTVRNLTPGSRRDFSFNYSRKIVSLDGGSTAGYGCNQISLVGYDGEPAPSINPGDVLEIVHQDYNSQAIRLDWEIEPASNIQRVRFRVGNLNTGLPYDQDGGSVKDDFVRGLEPGFTVSLQYSQAGFWNGLGNKPQTTLPEFAIYDGGAVTGGSNPEFWNTLEVMVRDDQLWIWWNGLLIPPDPSSNTALAFPVSISTPYFPVNTGTGKTAMRMFPGTAIRAMEVQAQGHYFNEFTNGNLKIV